MYKSGWWFYWFIDVVSVMPFELIWFFYSILGFPSYTGFAKFLRVLRLLRMVMLLKYVVSVNWFNSFVDVLKRDLVYLFIALGGVSTVIMFLFGLDYGQGFHSNESHRFIDALNYVVATLTAVVPSDNQVDLNIIGHIFNIILIIAGAVLFSALTAKLQSWFNKEEKLEEKRNIEEELKIMQNELKNIKKTLNKIEAHITNSKE